MCALLCGRTAAKRPILGGDSSVLQQDALVPASSKIVYIICMCALFCGSPAVIGPFFFLFNSFVPGPRFANLRGSLYIPTPIVPFVVNTRIRSGLIFVALLSHPSSLFLFFFSRTFFSSCASYLAAVASETRWRAPWRAGRTRCPPRELLLRRWPWCSGLTPARFRGRKERI